MKETMKKLCLRTVSAFMAFVMLIMAANLQIFADASDGDSAVTMPPANGISADMGPKGLCV